MGRTTSNTGEYFMHDAKPGKTLFILEQRWGNHGYAFWFKLLELLTASDGHSFSPRKPQDREYFRARMALPDTISESEILDLLADLGNIDDHLWKEHGIIWCQKLVDRLGDSLYKKRNHAPPAKPSCCMKKDASEGVISGSEIPPQQDIRVGNPEIGTEKTISDPVIHRGSEGVREGGRDATPPSAPPVQENATPKSQGAPVDPIAALRAVNSSLVMSDSDRTKLAELIALEPWETIMAAYRAQQTRVPGKAWHFFVADFARWKNHATATKKAESKRYVPPEPFLPTPQDDAEVARIAAEARAKMHLPTAMAPPPSAPEQSHQVDDDVF